MEVAMQAEKMKVKVDDVRSDAKPDAGAEFGGYRLQFTYDVAGPCFRPAAAAA